MQVALDLAGFDSVPEDSEVHVAGAGISSILVAIDVGVAELQLAKRHGFDAVISHHPAGGSARVNGYKVFLRHVDQMVEAGVPESEAKTAIEKKLQSLALVSHVANYDQVVVAARMMRLPLLSIHSPCDEVGRRIMRAQVESFLTEKPSATVSDVRNAISELREFRDATTKVELRLGEPNSPAGRVVVSHAAFTNGGYEIAHAYFGNGVNTLVYIHVAEQDLSKLRQEGRGNLVVTGHIASDWLGLNRLIEVLRDHDCEVAALSDLAA